MSLLWWEGRTGACGCVLDVEDGSEKDEFVVVEGDEQAPAAVFWLWKAV